MDAQVVWNLDARYKPELEVEIEIVASAREVPGFYFARLFPELEVELIFGDLEDASFLTDDELVALEDYTVCDAPARGYADAYRLAI